MIQVGSLVQYIFTGICDEQIIDGAIIYPKLNKIYTVRELVENNGATGVRLSEIVNPIKQYIGRTAEQAFKIEFFREVISPVNIDELLKEATIAV